MPLGTEVGLGPGHIVLEGDPVPPKGNSSEFSAHVYCGQPSPISATAEQLYALLLLLLLLLLLPFYGHNTGQSALAGTSSQELKNLKQIFTCPHMALLTATSARFKLCIIKPINLYSVS